MQREHGVRSERPAVPVEEKARQHRERQRHHDDERARVQRERAVEYRGVRIDRRAERLEPARHERLRPLAPRLSVQVIVERGRKHVAAQQRLSRKEQHVRHEEQRHGPDERFALPLQVRDGEVAGPTQQTREAAQQLPVDARERVEEVTREPLAR
jgi:hypothetical protein